MPEQTCIDPATLQRFVEDGLDAAEMDAVAAHVAQCDACFQTLRRLPENNVAADMRAAQAWPEEPAESQFAQNLVQKVLSRCGDAATVRFGANDGTNVSKSSAETAQSAQRTARSAERTLEPGDPRSALRALTAADGRLGPYRILREFRAGGMGVVFLAEDVHLKRPVALKVMKPALATDPLARQRFLGEAEKAAGIKHDHIVTIYQVGEDHGIAFIAMELLEGETLADRLSRDGRLPVHEVLRIGREAAEGLAAAHERGLIHRDIKPANIWMENRGQRTEDREQSTEDREQSTEDRGQGSGVRADEPSSVSCRVKILDFGLARAIGDDIHLTKDGVIIGTPAYMAPEQAKRGMVDPRSDLFSLGCVLYHGCTGVLPFEGDDTMSTLLSRMLDHPRPPRAINSAVPAALSELIMQMLARDPAQRPASARAVAQAIERIERWSGGVGRPAPSACGASRFRFRDRWRLWLAGAAAAVLLCAGGLLLSHNIIRDRDGDKDTEIQAPSGAKSEAVAKVGDGAPLARTDPPQPLPESIVKAWKEAGAEVGWVRTHRSGSREFVREQEGKPYDLPTFAFRGVFQKGSLAKLPAPVTAFGLGLTHMPITDTDLKELARLDSLQSLSLLGTPVTDAGLKELAGLKNLRWLELGNTRVTDVGLKELIALKSLESLSLGNTHVTGAGLKELTGLRNLRWLQLTDTRVTDAGLKELARLKNLHVLSLKGTKVTDTGLKELARLKNLQVLDLCRIRVTDTGLKELAGLNSLEALDLSFHRVTDAGLKELAGLKNLRVLYLGHIPVTDAGLKELAALKSLERLGLEGTNVTGPGLKELAGLKNLWLLDLGSTQVTDGGLKELAGLKNLQSLKLGGTKVTMAGVEELQKALPRCVITLQGPKTSPSHPVPATVTLDKEKAYRASPPSLSGGKDARGSWTTPPTDARNDVITWMEENAAFGPTSSLVAKAKAGVAKTPNGLRYYLLFGRKVLKSGRPTLLAVRCADMFVFELPAEQAKALNIEDEMLVAVESKEGETIMRAPRQEVFLETPQFDQGVQGPGNTEIRFTANYKLLESNWGNLAVRAVTLTRTGRCLTYYMEIHQPILPAERQPLRFSFNTTDFPRTDRSGMPIVLFVELCSFSGPERRGEPTVISNGAATLIDPAGPSP